jgi:hypothetical protein
LEHTFKPNCNNITRWNCGSYSRPFFIKRQERKESRDENHHNYIEQRFNEWSKLEIIDTDNNNPRLPFISHFLSLTPKEKIIFDELVDNELQEIVKHLKKWKEYHEKVKSELGIFKNNVKKIAHDLITSNLEGECNKEADFKFIPKLKKKIKCFFNLF